MRLRASLTKMMAVVGAMVLTATTLSYVVKSASAADNEKYDVVIANGRAARAPIS
jgi:hypothetical protein